jgi:hypothetical protein
MPEEEEEERARRIRIYDGALARAGWIFNAGFRLKSLTVDTRKHL